MDIVFIHELRVATIIGVYEWERRTEQTVSLDIDMGSKIARAAADDCIEQALDYSAVAGRLSEFVGTSRCKLLETLAEACIEILFKEFDVVWVRIKLTKPGAVQGARSVGVMIERDRDG